MGVSSIRATSSATLPCPTTTATSPDKSGFNCTKEDSKFTIYRSALLVERY